MSTTTRGNQKIYQVYRTDARGPSIHGIHRCIRGGLWKSVDENSIGPETYCMDTRVEPRSKSVTDTTEKSKSHTINFRLRDGKLF